MENALVSFWENYEAPFSAKPANKQTKFENDVIADRSLVFSSNIRDVIRREYEGAEVGTKQRF